MILAAAIVSFAAIPNIVLAQSVTASVSAEVKVEVSNDDKKITYSGVIIDCRGLGLQTAASPVIKSEAGKIIYGDKDLDFDKINEIGMAEYATSIKDSAARAGEHPLIVRAVKVDKLKISPILSNADAKKVVLANENDNFFKDLRVVFLTD